MTAQQRYAVSVLASAGAGFLFLYVAAILLTTLGGGR